MDAFSEAGVLGGEPVGIVGGGGGGFGGWGRGWGWGWVFGCGGV